MQRRSNDRQSKTVTRSYPSDLQQKTIEEKRQWLQSIRNAIRSKDLDEAADNQQPEEELGQTSILQFFLPLP